MNSETLFFNSIKTFLSVDAFQTQKFTPSSLLDVQTRLRSYVQSLYTTQQIEFDPSFHFSISLAVNNSTSSIRVNIVPLTMLGVEILMASGIHLDESLVRQIRKIQDQQLLHEIVSNRRPSSDQPERSVPDEVRTVTEDRSNEVVEKKDV